MADSFYGMYPYPLTTSSTPYLTAARGSGKTLAVQKAIYEALCNPYRSEPKYITTTELCNQCRREDTKYTSSLRHLIYAKEDLIKYMKYEENSVYGIAKQINEEFDAYHNRERYKFGEESYEIIKGDDKVENYIKDIEVKKKTGKKGSCMQYKFMLYRGHPFLTVENYDEDCNLSADFILSLAHICRRCLVGKVIFRDHKVIAISDDERHCGDDEKTKKPIWKNKSYIADCMDVDDYNPYIGAIIAINKCASEYSLAKYYWDSKSHLRRLREKIDRASEDA